MVHSFGLVGIRGFCFGHAGILLRLRGEFMGFSCVEEGGGGGGGGGEDKGVDF
jgi:hypothetical protein